MRGLTPDWFLAREHCRHASAVLLAACWIFAAMLAPAPSSAGGMHHAGVIVREGDDRLVYAVVAFPEERLTGLELLKRTGIPLVTVAFGGLGEGVCSIDAHGCPATDCRRRLCQGSRADDPFWKYFRQSGPGLWTEMALGASGSKVADGEVDGWSWSGADAKLPAMTLAEVGARAGVADVAALGSAQPARFQRSFIPDGGGGQGWPAYLAGGGLIVAVGGGAVVVARRRRAAP